MAAIQYTVEGIPAKGTLKNRWTELDNARSALKTRCEEYAGWTLPYIFPQENQRDQEIQGPLDSIGARAVNSHSNRVVDTLFTSYRPFVRLEITEDAKKRLEQKAGAEKTAEAVRIAEASLAKAEKEGMKYMDRIGFRPEAVTAAKSLVIVGNTLMYLPEKGNAQVYNLRDYCTVRDLNGVVVEIMTRDRKAFETFSEEVQAALEAGGHRYGGANQHGPGNTSDCTIYTQIKLQDDGRYHVYQHAETVPLTSHAVYTAKELPWIALTWNLIRGENYGRGLVEDYAGAFHACWILMEALVTGAAAAADIKFLVEPGSTLDVEELNRSKSGTYHQGRKDDITCPEVRKNDDFNLVTALLERFERQISQGFLLMQGTTRNAERVTAAEIRRDAMELEQSNGGIYSRLAQDWQAPVARIVFARIDLNLYDERALSFRIITGMDSLSRAGDLDNLQMFMQDLQMLNDIPEDVRAEMSLKRFIQVVGTARGVDYLQFMKTNEEKQAELQQQMAMQKQVEQQAAGAQAQVAVAKQAAA